MSVASSATLDNGENVQMKGVIANPANVSTVDPLQVSLDSADNPQNLSSLRKWAAVVVISSSSLCATCSSSVVCWISWNIPHLHWFSLGIVYRRRCRRGVSSLQDHNYPLAQSICCWSGHWAVACGPIIGGIWEEYCLQGLLWSLLSLYMAGGLCPEHM